MHRTWALTLLNRALLATLAWWVLTDGARGWDAWVIGVPTILVTAFVSASLMSRLGWSWRGSVRYARFFVRESLLGGFDVAKRAFDPRLPLDPGVIREPLRMQSDVARVMVANTLGLVPGSLTLEVDRDELVVHALDVGGDVEGSVASTQNHVAALLAMPAPRGDARARADSDR